MLGPLPSHIWRPVDSRLSFQVGEFTRVAAHLLGRGCNGLPEREIDRHRRR